MPSYKLPKEEHSKEDDMASGMSPDMYQRMITIPANSKILNSLSLGDKVEVILMGEVTRLEQVESEEYANEQFEVKVTEVMAYPEGYKEDMDMEMAEKDLEKGYKKASAMNTHGGSHRY